MLVCLHQVTPWRRHSCLPCRDSSRHVLRCLRTSALRRQIERLVPSTAPHSPMCSLRFLCALCVSALKSHSGLVTSSPPYAAFFFSLSSRSPPPPPPPSPTSPCSPKTLAPGPTSSPPSASSASPPACRGFSWRALAPPHPPPPPAPPRPRPPACRGFSWRALAPPPASNGPPAWSAAPF